MKPLFIFVFVTLSAAVCAQPPAPLFPNQNPSLTGNLREQSGMFDDLARTLNSPPPYTGTGKPLAVPPPLVSPSVQYPSYAESSNTTILGQLRTAEDSTGLLATPPPPAIGPVEAGIIEPKLVGDLDSSESDLEFLQTSLTQGTSVPVTATADLEPTDPFGNWALFAATFLTTAGLIWMAFIAYDYRQRWVQSLTVQNDRYLGGFDTDMEDTYGTSTSFSESFGLPYRSI